MIHPGIKTASWLYLTALEDTMRAHIESSPSFKPVKVHFFNLICTLGEILTEFSKATSRNNLNLYFSEHYLHKYERSRDLERYFFGMTETWRKCLDHGDSKLFLSLLKQGRNNRDTVKFFVKMRKAILKNINCKILQDISITHEDALTLAHELFGSSMKTFVIRKINQLFISLKRKFINTAKVDGSVIAEFFLNCIQQKRAMDINDPIHQQAEQTQIKKTYNPSKGNMPLYDLSFSEQFAEYYSQKEHDSSDQRLIDSIFQDLQEKDSQLIEQEWTEDQTSSRIQQLTQKGKVQYPDGWDRFLHTNQLLKQKLLRAGLEIDIDSANSTERRRQSSRR